MVGTWRRPHLGKIGPWGNLRGGASSGGSAGSAGGAGWGGGPLSDGDAVSGGGGGLAETAVVILPVQTASEAAVAAVICSVVTAGLAVPSTKAAVSAGHSHGDSMVGPGVASVARAGRQPPAQLVHQLRGRRTDDPGCPCCERHTNVCFPIVVICVFRKIYIRIPVHYLHLTFLNISSCYFINAPILLISRVFVSLHPRVPGTAHTVSGPARKTLQIAVPP